MAKMFYTLEETAQKLGKTDQEIKDMAAAGELQQFRDRDKLMFKCDQVDAQLSGGSDETILDDTGSPISMADSTHTGAIDLPDGTSLGGMLDESGVNVFETGEVDAIDSMAQTQVTNDFTQEEELALDSVGSGSGLLDLTRESDDTSLGAELLDEIYPGGDSGDSRLESAIGSSGVFDASMGGTASETGASGPSGLENLDAATAITPALGGDMGMMPQPMGLGSEEPLDAAWSGFGAGALMGTTLALVISLIVAISAIAEVNSSVTDLLAGSTGILLGTTAGLLVLSLILGAIGLVLGKAAASR